MLLGIHVNTFPRPTIEETLDDVAANGLECVHFNFAGAGLASMPDRIDEGLCDRIAQAATERGIGIATLSGTFNMIHPDAAVREGGLRRLAAVASVAARLGAKVIALCTGTRDPEDMWRRHPDNDKPDAWRDLLAAMARAVQIAEGHDVLLGVEPEVSNVVDSAVKARRLLDELGSPRVKIIVDGANLFHAGELRRMHAVLDEAFELLGEDIVVGHAKDLAADGQAGQIPAGKGLLDYDYYLDRFARIGFDGPLILHSLAEADVPECVRFLRGKLGHA